MKSSFFTSFPTAMIGMLALGVAGCTDTRRVQRETSTTTDVRDTMPVNQQPGTVPSANPRIEDRGMGAQTVYESDTYNRAGQPGISGDTTESDRANDRGIAPDSRLENGRALKGAPTNLGADAKPRAATPDSTER